MEQPTRRRPRRRPLETCGGVIVAMVGLVYKRIGTPALGVQRILEATSPFHCHLFAILTIADDHILTMQDTMETYFPSSSKISNLLIIAESLPEKLDGFLVTWVDWMLIHAIHWLESLVTMLGHWRDKNKGIKEKEITVDRSFARSGSMSSEEEKAESGTERQKATYKEALQRGSSGEDGGGSSGHSSSRGDPILQLFETGWIQNPIKRSSRSADSLTLSPSHSLS